MSSINKAEDAVMRATFKATMLRAADVIDKITRGDLLNMQEKLMRDGMPLGKVAEFDRAHLAAAYLRTLAEGKP